MSVRESAAPGTLVTLRRSVFECKAGQISSSPVLAGGTCVVCGEATCFDEGAALIVVVVVVSVDDVPREIRRRE
jgi:hypothetical protein